MAELKIGGSDMVKIMYGSQEIGGATKLEPGTILYMSTKIEGTIKNIHLLSTAKNWNNINGINVLVYDNRFLDNYVNVDIPSDDFKTLNIKKTMDRGSSEDDLMNISTSIVDGEYRLNLSCRFSSYKYIIKAI